MAERLFLDRRMPPGFEDLFVGWDVCGPDDAELETCRAAIAGASQWPAERIASAPSLEVISRSGIGFDTADLAAATAQGVIVCNTPDAPTISTAEHTMGLLLAVTKSLVDNATRLREGETEFYAASEAIELAGRTLGVVGFGRIGPRVARAAAALDMHVIVCDPYVTTHEFEMVTFAELLARSDVVTLHCPLTDETTAMVDADALAAMRPGAVLINAARGGVVDTDALVAALDSGQLRAAGLDVTAPEPLPPDHTLLHRANVIVTPHIASATDLGRRRMYGGALENVRMVLAGQRPVHVVNPEVFDR